MDRSSGRWMPGRPGTAVATSAPESDSGPWPQRADGANWGDLRNSDHIVQYYQSDAFLIESSGEFLAAALRAGDAAVVIATAPHRHGIAEWLRQSGLDLAAARDSGRYIALDAAATLARFMIEAKPDPDLFRATLIPVLRQAAVGGRKVRAFGEMVALLAEEGNASGAVALEAMWNDLQRQQAFSLLCTYPLTSMQSVSRALFDHVCNCHSRVLPTESFLALATADEQWRAVASLQQQAHQVEAAQTTLLLAEEKLRAACAAEEAAQHEREATRRLRDEFLSIASHELRNPLAGLSLHAQLALRRLTRDGHLDPAWGSQALHAITGQATRITRLLDQLLDVSRLETGAMALDCRESDLTVLVTQAVAEARVWSQRHTIEVVAPPLLAARLDPFRLEQALANLLHNAIKYTPPGGTIEVILSQPRPAQIQIVVRDNGPGIPPEARETVFDRFAAVSATGPTRGLGLGLYLSRQIVQLHGGALDLESPPEGGTRFVIRLPQAIGYRLRNGAPRANSGSPPVDQ